MILNTMHVKYYKQKKATIKSPLLKAFDKKEDINIHKLINLHCDIDSDLRLKRNRPIDRSYDIQNFYNLVRSYNLRYTKEDMISALINISCKTTKRKAAVLRLIKRLEC